MNTAPILAEELAVPGLGPPSTFYRVLRSPASLAGVLSYMRTVNAARGKSPGGWPESDWQRAQVATFAPNSPA